MTFDLFSVDRSALEPLATKPRPASDREVSAYLKWQRERRGLPAFDHVDLHWGGYPGSRGGRLCFGATFGQLLKSGGHSRNDAGEYVYSAPVYENGAYSLVMPGHSAHRECVTMEVLSEGGEVERSQTLPAEPKKGGVIWSRDDVRKAAGPVAKAAKPGKRKAVPVDMPETAPESAPERDSAPVTATTPAAEPEIVLSEAPAANSGQSEPGGEVPDRCIDQLAARLAAVEAMLATLPAVSGQGATPAAQVPRETMPKRTAAHERAIRRAWAERKAARLQRAIATDQMRMREQVQVDLRKVSADLATLRPQYDNAAKARHSFMLEMDRACASERVALRKRRRAVLLARDLMKRLNAEHRLVDRYIAEKREIASNLRLAEECLEAAKREPAAVQAATQFLHARAASESLLLMQARAETERQRADRAETALAALQARLDGWPPAVRRVTVNMAA